MATPYQNIAKQALINWNGLSEEEALVKVQNESVSDLENQVFAMNTIKYAVVGIAKQIDLSEDDTIKFFTSVVYGPDDDMIFDSVREKINGFSLDDELDVLTTIHDGWVVNNSDEKTFNKKVDREQLRQYAPLELIGWNEVVSDLLFLKPILESVGISVNEKDLEKSYHSRVSSYLQNMNINNKEDLNSLIARGKNYYDVLPQELDERLLSNSDVISNQIVNNWQKNDLETFNIFSNRQQDNSLAA